MINCHTIDAFVTPFVDGELPDEDRRAIDAHLRACPPCCSRVATERAVHELIRARQSALNAERAPALRRELRELRRTGGARWTTRVRPQTCDRALCHGAHA